MLPSTVNFRRKFPARLRASKRNVTVWAHRTALALNTAARRERLLDKGPIPRNKHTGDGTKEFTCGPIVVGMRDYA